MWHQWTYHKRHKDDGSEFGMLIEKFRVLCWDKKLSLKVLRHENVNHLIRICTNFCEISHLLLTLKDAISPFNIGSVS